MVKEVIYEVPADKFISALAAELKKLPEFVMPDWALFVKTSTARERVPENPDWWWIRAASILRQIYNNNVVGVNALRVKYGGKKNRGVKPERFRRASGKHIRTILQQSDAAGLTEKIKGRKTGRRLTSKGKEFLNNIANNLLKES